MLLEIPAKSQKNAKIMPDFFKKCHLNSKNAFVLFQTKRDDDGGGTPGAHHPPAWYVSCQLKFWPLVTVTVFPRIIAGGDFFFFAQKGGDYFEGGAYFKYCSLEVKWTEHELFKCSKFSSLINFPSLTGGRGIKERHGCERGLRRGDYWERRFF